MPLPSADTTPPVTKTYFGARAFTDSQASSVGGRRGLGVLAGPEERVEPAERLGREAAPEADQERPIDDQRELGALRVEGPHRQVGVDPVARQLEGDPLARDDVEHDERARHLGPAEIGT